MRKTLIALILVLPMVFVLVIFSSVNLVSLGVDIAVNGITIRAEGMDEEGTLLLDMADRAVHTVTADVSPDNATEKGYTLTSSDPTLVDVTKDGVIVPKKEGTAEITAKSNDKSFTDTMSVVVVSSKPYDFDLSLFSATTEEGSEERENLLTETEDGGYEATVPTGNYTYGIDIYPVEYTQYTLEQDGGYAEIERGPKTVFLPFSGDVELTVTVPGGVRGDIQKNVTLHVVAPTFTDEEGKPKEVVAIVNGAAAFAAADDTGKFENDGGSMQIAYGTTELRLYVECVGVPSFSALNNAPAIVRSRTRMGNGYIFDISIPANWEEEIQATISAHGKSIPFIISFTDFTFSVFSDRAMEKTETGAQKVTLLTGNAASFYAVASGGAKNVTYTWDFSGPKEYFSEQDGVVTIKATEGGKYTLTVTAKYGEQEPVEEKIELEIINKVSVVQINNKTKADLAASYVVAGMVYADDLSLKENAYPLKVYAHSTAGTSEAGDDIEYTVSDPNVAAVEMQGGKPVLIPKGSGEVTVTAAWKGNAAFKSNVVATLTVSVVKDAVAVKNAPELNRAMEEKRAAVLTENIKLGTDAAGNSFTDGQLIDVLKTHRMKSTYNLAWYAASADASENDAYISYALEFTADIYGNGKSIDADNFTHHQDANGTPLLKIDGTDKAYFGGPLYFVEYKQMASVAGQDNCAFLVRTDGITLYGVNLLGCSDSSLLDPETGVYNLSRLNLTGTTLEVNADCNILNCRIRNGRNVVRAYGGNRNGNGYFVESLSGAELAAEDHIDVKIDGCILSQGREFILKMGANRAIRASKANGQEPALLDQSGKAYKESGASNRYDGLSYDPDSYFYKHYVMTDLTLKDSVLETSGLFTVGIESNFAGEFLFEGAPEHQWRTFTKEWERSGGTSFASVLRLEGDVRLYDWKDLGLVDSSTLIESPTGVLSEWLKLDIKGMLDYVSSKNEAYKDVIVNSDDKQYVHGGIALYGGGRNYAGVVMTGLNEELKDFLYINVNIGVLSEAGGDMQRQGELLPKAAGTHDFNFYMYGRNSVNNYAKQRADEQTGVKYKNVSRLPLPVD